jgi:hypothetical protein
METGGPVRPWWSWISDEWNKTSQPLKERASVLPLGLYGDDYAHGGVKKRAPYESENAFFRSNPHVAGMATEDNKVALNPFSGLGPEQQDAVALNESARVWMRKPDWQPSFDITPEQSAQFGSYGSPTDQRSTIAARLISGDTSSGMPTQNQLEFSQRLASEMARTDYGLEDSGAMDRSVGLAWPGLLAAPAEGVANFGSHGYGEDAVPYNSRMALDAAGGAMTGSFGANLAGGMVDNALGSAGAKLTQSASDLPMDLASRMARAREMGFDTETPVYHGTSRSFDEFSPETIGQSDFGASGRGFYFSEDPGTASAYAMLSPAGNDPQVIKALLKYSNPYELDSALMPRNAAESQMLTDNIRGQGYDAIKIMGKDGIASEVITFDPRNIRSTSAAFDPAKSDSANLLAANAKSGAAIPLGMEGAQQDDEYPFNLYPLIRPLP